MFGNRECHGVDDQQSLTHVIVVASLLSPLLFNSLAHFVSKFSNPSRPKEIEKFSFKTGNLQRF